MGGIATSPIPIGQSIAAMLAFVVILLLPGLVVCSAAGLRSWASFGAAPLVTFGIVGALSPYATGSWLPWGVATLAGGTFVLAAVILTIRILWLRQVPAWPVAVPRPSMASACTAICIASAGAIGAFVVWRASQRFQAFPQWWDTTFHANAIRFIADSGNADPAALRIINFPTLTTFYYPSAYHALCALVVRVTGIPVEAVLNIGDALSTGLFALGLAALVVTLGGSGLTAGSVALLASAPASALYDIMVWGPLFPYVMGIALIPAFLVVLLCCLRTVDDPLLRPLILALAGLGLIAVHPGAAFAAVLLAALLVLQRAVQRELNSRAFLRLAVAFVLLVLLGFFQLRGFLVGAEGASFDWPASTTPAEAVGQLLLQDRVREFPQWWVLALSVLGLLGLSRQRPLAFYLVGTLVFAALYVGAASYEGPLVAETTRPWWNDPYRLLALASHGLVLLSGFGLAFAAEQARGMAGKLPRFMRANENSGVTRLCRAVGTLTVFLAVVVLTHVFYVDANVKRVRQLYGDGPTVTEDKLTAYRELARIVEPGARVMNDPLDGSAWMWGYAGVLPVFGHALMLPGDTRSISGDQRVLLNTFDRAGQDPEVDSAISRENVRYVIVTNGFISEGLSRAPGLQNLDGSQALVKIFENKDAVIYRVSLPPRR